MIIAVEEEAVEYMYERGFNSRGVENRVFCADMGKETFKIQGSMGHYIP